MELGGAKKKLVNNSSRYTQETVVFHENILSHSLKHPPHYHSWLQGWNTGTTEHPPEADVSKRQNKTKKKLPW